MKRLFVLALLMVVAAAAFGAEYDSDAVKNVMRGNLQFMGEIRAAVAQKDFFLTADKLYGIAKGMQTILPFDPPKGSSDDWQELITDFINTALIGIGACGTKDLELLNQSVQHLGSLMQQGHMEFRSR